MSLSFHPCIHVVSYQNIPWSYKNDVKQSGCNIELRRNRIEQFQPIAVFAEDCNYRNKKLVSFNP